MIAWIVRLVARLFGFSPAVADDAAKLATDLRSSKTDHIPDPRPPYDGPNTRN